jgi:ABC-2 type transport system ATP-binding protein
MSGVISVQKLVKRYGSKTVVDGLDLEIPQGAIYAFLGDNGAGKTSTIKVLVGMHPADSGTARILGVDCWSKAVALRNRVGYVPERPKFYEWMTVDEIGWFTGSFHKPGFLEHYRGWVKNLGLDPKKRLRDLSKGGYARVGLALALAPGPEVLILDEPTSGLDLLTRRDFLSSMVQMAGAGRTILISSHGISEVERVATHVGLIAHGKLLFSGPMEGIKNRFARFQFRTTGDVPEFTNIGKILHQQTLGRQVEIMVQDASSTAIDQIRNRPDVAEVEVGVPSLEDIYAAVMRKAGNAEREGPI